VLGGLLGALAVLAPGLQAATIHVTNPNDSGPGSLRDAIAVASRGDEIQFDAALAGLPIVLTAGELMIDKDLTITGLGRDQTIVDGNLTGRVFNVASPAVVTISMLTVRNGLLQPMIVPWPYGEAIIEEGGGIHNSGTLTLNDSTVRSNKISGKTCDENKFCSYRFRNDSVKGGGIFNSGTLVLNNSAIEQNQADGEDAYGGGIYSNGQVTMVGTTISGNSGHGDRAHGLQGIALFNDTSGTMAVEDGQVTGNSSGASQAIHNLGTLTLTRTIVGGNGYWRGGGLNNEGTATVLQSTVMANWTGAGGQQYGFGGGITNRGSLTLIRSTVSGNQGEGNGGAANGAGTLRIVDSTIGRNEGFMGAGGLGGAYAAPGATTIAASSTIAGNVRGGVRFPSAGMLLLKNSIIAGNFTDAALLPDDCEGSITSLGGSILGENQNCQGMSDGLSGDVVGIDWTQFLESQPYYGTPIPLLGDNLGPTYTVALLPAGRAVDHIPVAACTDEQGLPITTDQRGVPRPQGPGCDVGAFELSQPRGAGFWAHQCSDDGFHQIGPSDLQALFAEVGKSSSVFPECASISCDALQPRLPRNDIRARAALTLLDVWLNLETGRLTRGRPLDLPRLTSASTVNEALSRIELTVCDPKASRGDLGNAKDIAEALNGGSDDMELAAQASTISLTPGATGAITLGLINMSPDSRNYQVSASGPWPVRLSTSRINGLGSGDTALLSAGMTAPIESGNTTAQFQITATDLLSLVPLSRSVTVTLKVAGAGGSPGGGRRRPVN